MNPYDAYIRSAILGASGATHAHPSWTTTQDQGIYDLVVKAVKTPKGLSREDREDVVAEIVGGLSLPGGIWARLGQKFKDEIKAGKPPRIVASLISLHSYRYALSRANSLNNRKAIEDTLLYTMVADEESLSTGEVSALISEIESTLMERFKNAPTKRAIASAWLEGEGQTPVNELAESIKPGTAAVTDTGAPSGTYVYTCRVVREVREVALDMARKTL